MPFPKTAYAKHGLGWDRHDGQVETTFVFRDAACSVRLGWVHGHKPEGYVWGEGSEAVRLTIVSATADRRAA